MGKSRAFDFEKAMIKFPKDLDKTAILRIIIYAFDQDRFRPDTGRSLTKRKTHSVRDQDQGGLSV